MPSTPTRRGEVVEFDAARGLGMVADTDTGEIHPFHCIEIADGTRSIEAGALVEFQLSHKLGRPEARALVTQ
jgi:cold shock CspA family protein